MTTDAEGAKAFYDAVVGWNIGEAAVEFQGYRMIGRSDGKFAGGVLPLTDEMQQHGARPTWLGYIHVADVDAAVASNRASRRQDADAADRHPECRPDRDGRRPAGRALLYHEADPAGGRSECARATFSRRRRATGRLERAVDQRPGGGAPLLRRAVRLDERASSCRWASWANIASSSRTAVDDRRGCQCNGRAAAALALLCPGAVDRQSQAKPSKPMAERSPWGRWKCPAATTS